MVLQNLFRESPQRSPSDFIGREKELSRFNRALHQLPYEKCIINISGPAGIGKTELLRQYRRQMDGVDVVWALVDEPEADIPSVMGTIAEQFKKQEQPLKTFGKRYRTYLQCVQQLESDPDKPKGLTKTIGQVATKGLISGAKQIPGVSVAIEMFGEKALTDQGGEWLAFAAQKLTNKDDVRLVNSPVEELTPLFVKDLSDVPTKHLTALFFDTYERTSSDLDPWLRQLVLDRKYGDLPDKLLLVIAGQRELSRTDWDKSGPKIQRQPLKPFEDKEVQDFLKQKGIAEASLVAEILEQSEGLPLLLNTLAVQAPTTPRGIVDRAEDVVDRYLRWIEDPQKRKLVLDAALARSFNQDVIATLTTPEQADDLFDWLVKQPFVHKKAKTWCYESLMQKLMVSYKRQRSVLEWVTLHENLAQLYQQLCDIQGLDASVSQDNLTWQHYQREKLYHQLCQAPQRFLQSAFQEFLTAFKRHPLEASRWAATIQQAGEEAEFEELRQWGDRMIRGVNAYDKEKTTDAIALFTTFLKQIDLEPEWQAKVFHWRGNLYARSNDKDATALVDNEYAAALADLDEAIQLMPQVAEYYRDRGLVHLFCQQAVPALDDLSKAIELNPEDAKAIAYRGTVYLFQEEYSTAIHDFSSALELRPDFQAVLISRAATYRVLGEYKLALADLNQALERVPGTLSVIAQRGKLYQEMGQLDDALSDLTTAVDQCPDDVIGLLLSRGTVYQQMERYQDALEDFNRILELNPDDQETQEALASRGETYRQLERYEAAIADLSRVIEKSPNDFWALGIRGTAYRQFSYLSQALDDFNQVINLDPDNPWWLYSRALTHQLRGQVDSAQSDLAMTLQMASSSTMPTDIPSRLNLALYFLATKDVRQAVAIYKEVLPALSPWLSKSTVREWKELFAVISVEAISPPHSPEATMLREVLHSYETSAMNES